MQDTKIQWHPGFVAAMNLEFAKERAGLILLLALRIQSRLYFPHRRILPILREQLFMGSVLHDLPIFHHIDTIRIPDRG